MRFQFIHRVFNQFLSGGATFKINFQYSSVLYTADRANLLYVYVRVGTVNVDWQMLSCKSVIFAVNSGTSVANLPLSTILGHIRLGLHPCSPAS